VAGLTTNEPVGKEENMSLDNAMAITLVVIAVILVFFVFATSGYGFGLLYKLYRRRPFKRFWRIIGQEDIRDLFKKSTWIRKE